MEITNKVFLGIAVVAIIVVLGVVGYSNFAKKNAPVTNSENSSTKFSDATNCTDITKIDFKNTTIIDDQFGALQFNNGFCESKEEPGNKSADWEHIIIDDFTLTPEPSQIVRFIKINSNHLTGSGAWDRLIGFKCERGIININFDQKGLYGIQVQKLGEKQLSLTIGEWAKNDPMCCPSQEKVSIFQWSSKDHIFSLESEKVQKTPP